MKNIKWILLLILLGSCSVNIHTLNKIKSLSEENGQIKQRIILEHLGYDIDWNKVDSLCNVIYKQKEL
jgi:hypothetical protein